MIKSTLKIFLLTIIYFNLLTLGNAQIENASVAIEDKVILLANSAGGKITLRVMPTDPVLGYDMLQFGYDVFRIGLDNGMVDFNEDFVKLNSTRVLPIYDKALREGYRGKLKNNEHLKTIENILNPVKKDISSLSGEENTKQLYQYLQFINMSANVLSCEDSNSAKILGLSFEDYNVSPGQEYLYKIIVYGQDDFVNGEVLTRIMNKPTPLSEIDIDHVKETNSKVHIYWDFDQSSEDYFLYHVERSKDGSSWTTLNDTPYLPLFDKNLKLEKTFGSYTDSLANYDSHFYRVRGISYFGQTGPDGPSVKAQAVDDIPASSPILESLVSYNPDSMIVSWQTGINEQQIPDPEIKGYNVYKSPSNYGPYFKLNEIPLSSTDTVYVDELYNSETDTYYRVCSIDEHDNLGCSLTQTGSYIDTIPPYIPTGLTGEVDSSGIVTLNWDGNTDKDLWGYFVYIGNNKSEDFVRITGQPLVDSTFTDTISLNTLTKDIYYQISAIDIRTNISLRSEKIQLERPDTIPPSAAVFVGFEALEEGNKLQWIPSSFMDVEVQIIERKTVESNSWTELTQLPFGQDIYIDSLVEQKTKYVYRINTLDDAGNQTYTPKNMVVKSWYRKGYAAPENFSASSKDNSINLQWNTNSKQLAEKIFIYRAIGERKLKPHYSGEIKIQSVWVDEEIIENNEYKYKMRLRMKDGLYTAYTPIVSIKSIN